MATQTATRPTTAQTTPASGTTTATQHPSPEKPAPAPTHPVDLQSPAFSEAFGEIDQLEGKPPKTAPEAAPAPKGETPVPASTPPSQAKPDAREAKPAPAAKPEDKPLDPNAPDPTSKWHLAHDLRRELRKSLDNLQKAQTELAQYKERGTNPEAGEPPKALVEENRTLKKRLQEYDAEMRWVDYTRSQEFKEKFEVPIQNALADAYDEIKEFSFQREDGSVFVGTPEDFNKVLNASPEAVRRVAGEIFGEYAQDVINIRRRIVDIRRNADREAKKYRDEAQSRESQRLAKQVEERETMEKLWKQANTEVAKSYPQYFGKVEGDEELNTLLDKGYALVEKANDPNLPMEERVERLAILRNKAAGFSAMQLRLKRAQERVKELEGVVAGYEQSEPKEGKPTNGHGPGSQGTPDGYISAEQELERLASINPD